MQFPLSLVPYNTKINFIRKKNYAFAIGAFLTILVVVLLFIRGLNFGIDFTGGIILDIEPKQAVSSQDLRKDLQKAGYHNVTLQDSFKQTLALRLQLRNPANYLAEVEELKALITRQLPAAEFRKIDYIGPKVGAELVNKAIIAVSIALIAIMAYVTFRFNWRFGVGIVLALLHDAFATLGFYMVSGYEFDLTSIAALLTIIGYSVNDSVVIYDRIRENLPKHPKKPLADIINMSLNETLSRSIMTAVSTLAVCLALIIFGGESMRGLSMAMFFGIAFGTYSSIYISAAILLVIDQLFRKRS